MRNPRIRWVSARSRHDGSPTDTQADTENQSPRQDATDKTKVGSTVAKDPVPRTNSNINETPTGPKSQTHPSHECDGRVRDPEVTTV